MELEEAIFVEPLGGKQVIVFYFQGMDREIFTKGAFVDPAIGEDKEILRHLAGTGEFLPFF